MAIPGLNAASQDHWRVADELARKQRAEYSKIMAELQQRQFDIKVATAARIAREKDTLGGAFSAFAPAETDLPALPLGNRLDTFL